MKRKLTPLAEEFYKLAKHAGLKNPLGRALALVNRCYNTSVFGHHSSESYKDRNFLNCKCDPQKGLYAITLMSEFKPETALRWLNHWNNGGSLKSLNH